MEWEVCLHVRTFSIVFLGLKKHIKCLNLKHFLWQVSLNMVLLHVHFEANTTDTLYNSVGLWLEVEFPFIPYFSHRSVLRPAPFVSYLQTSTSVCVTFY